MNPVRQVREAAPSDFGQAMKLYGELAGPSQLSDDQSGLEKWREILSHLGTTVFCVEQDGLSLGLTTLHVLPNVTYHGRSYALIENVVTLKTQQKSGIGKLLMNHVIDHAWQQDCYKIMLLTGKNAGAKGFYQRQGFSDDEKFGMTMRRIPTRQNLE